LSTILEHRALNLKKNPMRFCPRCHAQYPNDHPRCARDGSLTVTSLKDLNLGRQIGNYILEARLAEGGMGTVYQASHKVLGRKVAIKILRSDLALRPDM